MFRTAFYVFIGLMILSSLSVIATGLGQSTGANIGALSLFSLIYLGKIYDRYSPKEPTEKVFYIAYRITEQEGRVYLGTFLDAIEAMKEVQDKVPVSGLWEGPPHLLYLRYDSKPGDLGSGIIVKKVVKNV